jgi:outer membrane protein assembly factor BamB
VGDGVFVRTESGVTALSTSDGQLIWEQSVPKNTRDLIHGANLAVANETIFVVSDVLRAIDIRTGDVRWTVEGEAAGRSLYNRGFVSPVTDGSSVYTGIGTVQSFNADSGATNWTGGGFPAFLNPLTYDPETTTLYVSTVAESEMKVVGINSNAGTELWQVVVGETRSGYALSRSEISRPIPHDASVYVACRGTSISISERELDLTDSDSSTPTVTEDTGPDDSENQEREPQTTNTGQTTDPSTGEYRGLISNNPNTDIGNQLGDMYVLTLLSTALSIFVMLGQAFRRRGE